MKSPSVDRIDFDSHDLAMSANRPREETEELEVEVDYVRSEERLPLV
ncbi:hypothetical protein ACQPZF_26800 [Actinosynnema sp. CS-041913]